MPACFNRSNILLIHYDMPCIYSQLKAYSDSSTEVLHMNAVSTRDLRWGKEDHGGEGRPAVNTAGLPDHSPLSKPFPGVMSQPGNPFPISFM
jgi:hypothetical protein